MHFPLNDYLTLPYLNHHYTLFYQIFQNHLYLSFLNITLSNYHTFPFLYTPCISNIKLTQLLIYLSSSQIPYIKLLHLSLSLSSFYFLLTNPFTFSSIYTICRILYLPIHLPLLLLFLFSFVSYSPSYP